MIKEILILFLLLTTSLFSRGQDQTIQTQFPNIIEITFTSTETTSGDLVVMPFTTPASLGAGVTSFAEELKVNSNNNFNVSVSTNAANFTYTGSEIANTTMPVNKLSLSVTSNATGGSIGSGFQTPAFKPLGMASQSLITNGYAGTDQTFTIKYRATPGYNYAGGAYTVDVIFTATQP